MKTHTTPSYPTQPDPDEQAIVFNNVSSARHVKLDELLKQAFTKDRDEPQANDKPLK